jgi:hypothetical protein
MAELRILQHQRLRALRDRLVASAVRPMGEQWEIL